MLTGAEKGVNVGTRVGLEQGQDSHLPPPLLLECKDHTTIMFTLPDLTPRIGFCVGTSSFR